MPSKLTSDQIETITQKIKSTFYYLEYPSNVPESLWKDGNGDKIHMSDLSLGRIQSCIKMVQADITKIRRSMHQQQVIDAIIPLAEQKLGELENAFRSKVGI